MKKLRKNTYLIEGPGQLWEAVDQTFDENPQYKPRQAYIEAEVEIPDQYPYVAVIDVDVDARVITVGHVSINDFMSTDPEGKIHLYEFKVRKTSLAQPYLIREYLYQMPAKDLVEAILKTGQSHHNDEYLFEILSWNQVN